MLLYIDREEVPDIENIPSKTLQYVLQCANENIARYFKLKNYYLGNHKKFFSDNEVNVSANYAKYVVDVTVSYFLGNPVKYDSFKMNELQPLLDMYDCQNINETDLEIAKNVAIFGECLELCYMSSTSPPIVKSSVVKPYNGVLVCDSSVEHKKLFAVIWEKRRSVQGYYYYFVTVYTDKTIKSYKSTSVQDAYFAQYGETKYHCFQDVPVINYLNNSERQGDFEQVIPLIDAYNQLLSSRLTDKKNFVNALLVFFGMSLDENSMMSFAKEKFIDAAPLDARAEYVQKTFDETQIQILADSIVREIHKMTMTVDMSDEKFSGNSSGQALKLKLLTMNLYAKNKIRRMQNGLKQRLILYSVCMHNLGIMQLVPLSQTDIVFTLSTPVDDAQIVDTVVKLQGIVDNQTLVSQLPFIQDVQTAKAINKQ